MNQPSSAIDRTGHKEVCYLEKIFLENVQQVIVIAQ